MKIKRNLLPRLSLTEFAEAHDLTLVITETPLWRTARFEATLEGACVIDGGTYKPCVGTGATEEGAIADFCLKVSGCRLVLLHVSSQGRPLEVDVPHLSWR